MKTANISVADTWSTGDLFSLDRTGKDFKQYYDFYQYHGGEEFTIDSFRKSEHYKGVDYGFDDSQSLLNADGYAVTTAFFRDLFNPIIAPGTRFKTEEWFNVPGGILTGWFVRSDSKPSGYELVDPNQRYSFDTIPFFTNNKLFSRMSPRTLGTWFQEMVKNFDATNASGIYTLMSTPKLEKLSFNPGAVFLQKNGDGQPLIIGEGESVGYEDISNMMMGSRVATISVKYRQLQKGSNIDTAALAASGVIKLKEDGSYTVVSGKEFDFNAHVLGLPYEERTLTIDFTFDPIHIDWGNNFLYDDRIFERAVEAAPDYRIDLRPTAKALMDYPYFAEYLDGLPKQGTLLEYKGTKFEDLLKVFTRRDGVVLKKDLPDTRWTKSFYQLLQETPDAMNDKDKLNELFKRSPEYAYLTSMWHSNIKVPVYYQKTADASSLEQALRVTGIRTDLIDFKDKGTVLPKWVGGTYGNIQPTCKSGDEFELKLKLKDSPFFTANPTVEIEAKDNVISVVSSTNQQFSVTLIAEVNNNESKLVEHLNKNFLYEGNWDEGFTGMLKSNNGINFAYNYTDLYGTITVPETVFVGNDPEATVPANPYVGFEAAKLKDLMFYKTMQNIAIPAIVNGNAKLSLTKPVSKFNVLALPKGYAGFGVIAVYSISEMINRHTKRVYVEDESSTTFQGNGRIRLAVKEYNKYGNLAPTPTFHIELTPFTKFSDAEASETKMGFVVSFVGKRADLAKFNFLTLWKAIASNYYLRWADAKDLKAKPAEPQFLRSMFTVDEVDVMKLPEGSGTLKEYDESYADKQPIGNFHRLKIVESYHAEVGSEAFFIYRPSLNKFTD